MAFQTTSKRSAWYKLLNGDTFTLLDTKSTGLGQHTLNRIPGITAAYGRDVTGVFKEIAVLTAAPGDFDSVDLTFLEEVDDIHEILKLAYRNKGFFVQRLTYSCPPVNSRTLWKQLEHYKVYISAGTRGMGPNRDGSDELVEDTMTLSITELVHIEKTDLSTLTSPTSEDIFCIAGMGDDIDCLEGWPGADQILVFGHDDDGATAPGEVLYSFNGGGSIVAVTTDPTPFTEVSGINNIALAIMNDTQFRVVCSRETDAAVKAMFAYQDFVWVGSTMTAASWNVVTIDATAVGDYVEAMLWAKDLSRLYLGAAGDIYLNTDDAESDPGAAIYTGANTFAGAMRDIDDNIWFYGATGTMLRETDNNRGTFAARTAPNSDAVHSMTMASDGVIIAGIGTSVYKSVDRAGSTAGWEELKDFGTSHAAVDVVCKGGSSQILRVTVDDATPGAGSVFESEDGGNTWRLITETSNTGYNAVYHKATDYNQSILVGDGGTVELLA